MVELLRTPLRDAQDLFDGTLGIFGVLRFGA